MERLPRGRHGLSPEFVAQNQCERLLAALTEILYERGYEETTVATIGKRAGVSKSDFYKRYESKDACFLAAYADVVERIREMVRAACAEADDWAGGVLGALGALLTFVVEEPARARLVLVEGLRAGKGVYDLYQEALQGFVPLLRDGAPVLDGVRPPEATDEAVVGGIASLLARRMLAGRVEPLGDFLPEIAEFTLTPYLGAAEARRIISER